MKRIAALLTALCLLLAQALAETTIDPKEARNIPLTEAGENETPDGISPTTGRTLRKLYVPEGYAGLAATGRYLPMLVQIGNDGGGVGNRAPWGVAYADILYETPLTRSHETRITAVFSDMIPDSVGFVRSARIGHVWLSEEWGGGFLFYGQQEVEGSDVKAEIKRLGADLRSVIFSGITGGTNFKRYFTSRAGAKSPYDVDANVAAMSRLVPEDHVAPNHAFRFTDDAPDGDSATRVYINWGDSAKLYNSRLVYRKEWNGYLRYMGTSKTNWYADRDSDDSAIAFQNVIVQFTRVDYNHNNKNEPIMYVIGENGETAEGNADFFLGGKHISGYWKRDSMTSRTVYYDASGEEIALLRGRTLIVIFPDDAASKRSVSYE